MDHHHVHDDERGHGFDDGHRAGDYAGVVAAARGERAGGAVVLGGHLGLGDRRGGLEADPKHNHPQNQPPSQRKQQDEGECEPEVDILPVRDPALHASTPVRLRAQLPVLPPDERVVVLRARDLGPAEAGTDLEGLGGGDGEHGVPELGLEFVEDGLAEAGGDVADDAGDGAADGVVGFFGADDALFYSRTR